MKPNSSIPERPDPFDHYDRELPFKDNSVVSIARVRAKSDYLKGNVIGDRVALPPQKAQWLAKHGVVVVEVAKVLPSEIREAGSVDAYLTANPKADKLSKHERERLGPIPGIPTGQDKKKPWDFERV